MGHSSVQLEKLAEYQGRLEAVGMSSTVFRRWSVPGSSFRDGLSGLAMLALAQFADLTPCVADALAGIHGGSGRDAPVEVGLTQVRP